MKWVSTSEKAQFQIKNHKAYSTYINGSHSFLVGQTEIDIGFILVRLRQIHMSR